MKQSSRFHSNLVYTYTVPFRQWLAGLLFNWSMRIAPTVGRTVVTRSVPLSDLYLMEPYSRLVIFDGETKTFTGQVVEFPGCVAQGNTLEEVHANLEAAAHGWIEAALGSGQDIPQPIAMSKVETIITRIED